MEIEIRLEHSYIGSLQSGDCDVLAMTYTYTPERAKRSGLTETYFPVRIVVVEPTEVATHTRKRLGGKRVGVAAKSVAKDSKRPRPTPSCSSITLDQTPHR